MDFTIDDLTVPHSVDAADAADFLGMVAVRGTVERLIIGNSDLDWSAEEALLAWRDEYEPTVGVVAKVDGDVVAFGSLERQSEAGVTSAWLAVQVLPAFRGHGIGRAVHERLLRMAADDGRGILQAFVLHSALESGEAIDSPTGFGRVFTGDPATRFLLALGYRLAQIERISRLELPAPVTVPPAPHGYAVEFWQGRTPAEHLDGLAALHASMSTDAPLGELDYRPEVWDAARVRSAETREIASGRTLLTVVARHVDTATLVGFSQLAVPAESDRPAFQQDTIVSSAHRGHRLGMLLKLANLHRLDELVPGHPSVYTWNAEENRHMLSVNEAVGFRAVGLEAGWRRDL
ncbi:MAG: hypothetical protein RI885_534 [Actinomycetota bacterium]